MKKETRGGSRPNAGRKPRKRDFSEKFKAGIFKALKKIEKETGISIYDLFVYMLYDKKVQDSVRASLWKILAEVFVVKESKQTIEQHNTGPMIFLPEIQKKPEEFEEMEKRFKEERMN